jgi:hypothetical protein
VNTPAGNEPTSAWTPAAISAGVRLLQVSFALAQNHFEIPFQDQEFAAARDSWERQAEIVLKPEPQGMPADSCQPLGLTQGDALLERHTAPLLGQAWNGRLGSCSRHP